MGKFVILKSSNGKFYFNLKAGNGETILTSEMYETKQGCLTGIASVKVNAPTDERYQRFDTPNYRFNLKAANGEIIGTSEIYSSKAAREVGIESCKREAPGAETIEITAL